MKKLILLNFIILFCMKSFSQEIPIIPLKDGVVEYSEVVELNNPKDIHYSNLKSWIATYFVSAKSVIELDDRENGKLIAKATLHSNSKYLGQNRPSTIRILLQVDCKESKYRYNIKILEYAHSNTSQTIPELIEIANGRKKSMTNNKSYAKKQLLGISDSIEPMISSLKSAMTVNDEF